MYALACLLTCVMRPHPKRCHCTQENLAALEAEAPQMKYFVWPSNVSERKSGAWLRQKYATTLDGCAHG